MLGRFLGSSGQPANDIYKFSKLDDRLHILEKTLTWCHLAPTAPDTLGIFQSLFFNLFKLYLFISLKHP